MAHLAVHSAERWCISPKPYCELSITCFIPVSEARTIASIRR